jgi:pimeloyl-ACP methyl ester carboxylesterase
VTSIAVTSVDIIDRFIGAEDGLKLHLRDYAPTRPADGALPVLCLPGLTRTAEDFDTLARALTGDNERPRRVLAMDSRGRGLSDRDPNPANYAVPIEARDVTTAADSLGVSHAIVIGSSRGGLVALTLAAMRPSLLAGVAFNDIGPVIEMAGLIRIASYAGKMPTPRDHAEGATALKALFGTQFPALRPDEWQEWSRRNWTLRDGQLAATCDPAVALSLASLDPAQPLPALWELFDKLPTVPLMVLRGEHSDLLSAETVAEMLERRGDATSAVIAGQGHTPLLADAPTIALLTAFCARCDG